MPHPLTRRSFLKATAGAGAMASFATTTGARPRAMEAPPGGWFDQPMRWVQLTLVENDPGRFDPAFWLDYFRRLHADAATLSAGGIVAYYPTEVPLHHRSAWLGDSDPFGTLAAGCRAQGMRVVARTDPHAVRDEVRAAHPDWIAVNADGSPRRHWANKDLWVTCALGPYNFDFMDAVHREIVSKYQRGRHLREPLGAARRRLLLRALRTELQDGDRAGPAAPGCDRRGPARVRRVAHRAVDGVVEALGRDRALGESRGAIHPQRPAGFEDRRRAGRHPVHRQPGAARPDAALGQRPPREGVPLGDGPAPDRRHLQRRRGRAVPLEGLRAERAGDPVVGGRGHGQWDAAVGHEVLGRPLRPPLAARRRADLRLAFPSRALPAQRGASRAGGAALLGTDGEVSRGRGPHRPCGRSRPGDVSRAGRIPRALRAGPRGLPDRRKPRPVQAAHPRRRRRTLHRAVRRHPPFRCPRRKSAGDLRLVALRRGRRATHRLRVVRCLRRVVFADVWTGPCRTRISAWTPTPVQTGGIPSSTASATRPASSTACSGSTCSRAKTGRRP